MFSFVRASNTSGGRVDVLAIMNWIKNSKQWLGDIVLGNVKFGYEITSATEGKNSTTNSFSVSSS